MIRIVLHSPLERARAAAWLIAAVGVIGSAVTWIADRRAFAFAYLIAFVFWLSVALGQLAVLMLQHVMRSGWGRKVRPWLAASASVFPLLALAFLPVLLNVRELYDWARPAAVAADPLLQHKHAYLNVPAFVLRACVYFAGWSFLARALADREHDMAPADVDDAVASPRRVRLISGWGLVFFVLSATFAAIDWVRSLAPHWVSSTFGLYLAMGMQVAGFAMVALVAVWLRRLPEWAERIDRACLHDLGKLLFTSVTLWAYIAFTQYLIIWSGSIPEETEYYSDRLAHGFRPLSIGLIALHFALPFVLLMPRRLNERGGLLAAIAAFLLLMRLVDVFWMIAPAAGSGVAGSWLVLAPMLGLGGAWCALALSALQQRTHPSQPKPSPELAEAT